MITLLVGLHCVGMGATAAYLVFSNWFASAMRSSGGFSKREIVLLSLGWEIYWAGVALSVAKEKRDRAR